MSSDYFPIQSDHLPHVEDAHHDYEGMAYSAEPTANLSRDVEGQDGIPLITSPSHQVLSPDPSYDSYTHGRKQHRVSITGRCHHVPKEAYTSNNSRTPSSQSNTKPTVNRQAQGRTLILP